MGLQPLSAPQSSSGDMTSISAAHVKAARQAVTPLPSSPTAKQGVGLVGQALKTPSWTSIVEAYHKDGGGDREMLLALLHAKAKEDERWPGVTRHASCGTAACIQRTPRHVQPASPPTRSASCSCSTEAQPTRTSSCSRRPRPLDHRRV